MTQEEKELLLKDLCSRLPYHCRVFYEYVDDLDNKTYGYSLTLNTWCIDEFNADKAVVKPYLRSMSSMTEEEKETYYSLCYEEEREEFEFGEWTTRIYYHDTINSIDYLNSIHIDYRGLIEKGLAIEVTKDNNQYKE